MKPATIPGARTKTARPATRAASRLPLVLVLAAGLLLAGVGFWFAQRTRPTLAETAAETTGAPAPRVLSEMTQQILARITTPLEVRFYAPADGVALPENLRGYIGRVATVLAEYERVAAGKLRVQRHDPQTEAAAKTTAAAAGIRPFASETGEIVYLGLTVGNGARSEVIAPLAPEWEAALESDLSRAIQRLNALPPAPATTRTTTRRETESAPIDPALRAQLEKLFPDLQTRSYDDMAQELRLAALEEFKAGVAELQSKVAAAQQTLAAAQANKGAVEQQEALQQLQRVQAEQAEKLKGITAWLQARLTVLQQLKAAPELPVPAR
jgi:hypothetical protein